MNKQFLPKILLLICFLFLASYIFYHNVGWFKGDTLEYIKENFTPNGNTIIDGTYISSGEDQQGGFVIYQVTTSNEESLFVRVDVEFHQYLDRTGPDYKIIGIRTFDYHNLDIQGSKHQEDFNNEA